MLEQARIVIALAASTARVDCGSGCGDMTCCFQLICWECCCFGSKMAGTTRTEGAQGSKAAAAMTYPQAAALLAGAMEVEPEPVESCQVEQ